MYTYAYNAGLTKDNLQEKIEEAEDILKKSGVKTNRDSPIIDTNNAVVYLNGGSLAIQCSKELPSITLEAFKEKGYLLKPILAEEK